MKNFLKNIWLAVCLAVISAPIAWSQATMRSTTLSAAVSLTDTTLTVASATGITVGMTYLVDKESGTVSAISGTRLTVNRRSNISGHTSGEVIYVDLGNYFGLDPSGTGIPFGSCTSANELVLPRIDPASGDIFRCTNSEWAQELNVGGLEAKLDLDLDLKTTSDGRQVELNSRNFTQTSGSSIGFHVAPAQNATTTGSIIGGEITPRINNTFTTANIIGLHVDTYLRGTTARTISGNVRGQQIELVTDDAATNTVSGDVVGLRFRAAFSATTVTGHMAPFKVEKAEAQTNSQDWDALFKLTGASNVAWTSDTGSGDTESGALKILWDPDNNGTFDAGYLLVYSDAP